jgi:SAM-dependent methyltransferase
MSYAPRSERLLEIGCGNGFFLEVALDLGFNNVCGVEPSYQAIAAASPRVRAVIRNEMFDRDSFGLTRFDAICFFQTIEHVADPNQLLNDCHRLLRDRGLVLCIAHNVEAFPARALGERSPIIDVQHTHLFSKTTLRRIFEKNGFDVIDVFDVHNLFSLKYLLHMAPLPTLLNLRVADLLRTSGIGDWRIRLSLGNIGIAALKEGCLHGNGQLPPSCADRSGSSIVREWTERVPRYANAWALC